MIAHDRPALEKMLIGPCYQAGRVSFLRLAPGFSPCKVINAAGQ